APIDVAEFLRRRLFGADTSVIMTSATLSISEAQSPKPKVQGQEMEERRGSTTQHAALNKQSSGLSYFVKRVGAEDSTQLQVGTPFDYERQMKLYVAGKMPDPRDSGYRDAMMRWIEHFITQTHGKAFVLFTNFKLMQEVATLMQPFFDRLKLECYMQ